LTSGIDKIWSFCVNEHELNEAKGCFDGQKGPLFSLNVTHHQWKAINRKQITRWQHVSQLKASSFGSW
jgi:hypothetical protein